MKDIQHWSSKIEGGQTPSDIFWFDITGAKTNTPLSGPAVLTAYDAIAAQSTIDNFLGTTNEFLIIDFDATAMGTDAIAFIVNYETQVNKLVMAEVTVYDGNTAVVTTTKGILPAGLTASTLANEAELGAEGNVAVRAVVTGLDALTSGVIKLELFWGSK